MRVSPEWVVSRSPQDNLMVGPHLTADTLWVPVCLKTVMLSLEHKDVAKQLCRT